MLPCGMKDASLSLERRVVMAGGTRRNCRRDASCFTVPCMELVRRPWSSARKTAVLLPTHRTAQPDALRSSAHHAALLSLFPRMRKTQHPSQPSQRQKNRKSSKTLHLAQNRHNNLFMNHLSRAHTYATSRNLAQPYTHPAYQAPQHIRIFKFRESLLFL